MYKTQTFLIALLLTSFCYSQNVLERELAGKWRVEKILKSPDIPQAKPLLEGFSKAIFNLGGDGDFKLSTTSGSELFAMVTKMTDDTKWIFNTEEQLIQIGNKSEGYSIMGIQVQEKDGVILFELQETGILLEMNKLKEYKLTREESKEEVQIVRTEVLQPVELVYKDLEGLDVVPFDIVEEPPLAPACKPKWSKEKKKKCTRDFIAKHIQRKFNTGLAGDLGLTGRVRIEIKFVIDTTGKVINAYASGGPEPMNQNGEEVISQLANLLPGTKNGKPIYVSYMMPLIFVVQD